MVSCLSAIVCLTVINVFGFRHGLQRTNSMQKYSSSRPRYLQQIILCLSPIFIMMVQFYINWCDIQDGQRAYALEGMLLVISTERLTQLSKELANSNWSLVILSFLPTILYTCNHWLCDNFRMAVVKLSLVNFYFQYQKDKVKRQSLRFLTLLVLEEQLCPCTTLMRSGSAK